MYWTAPTEVFIPRQSGPVTVDPRSCHLIQEILLQVTEPVLVPDTLSLLPNAHTSHIDSSQCVTLSL